MSTSPGPHTKIIKEKVKKVEHVRRKRANSKPPGNSHNLMRHTTTALKDNLWDEKSSASLFEMSS